MTYINREPVKVIAQIIQNQLGLEDDHIIVGEEKFDIPVDKTLFVALFDEGPKPISRSNRLDTDTNEEIGTVTRLHPIRIEICSFNNEARQRKEEVVIALGSIYAQQVMEQYQCQVASDPVSFVDTSSAEPSSILKRYSAVVNVTAMYGKVQAVPASKGYFSKFNVPPGPLNPPDGTVYPPEAKS
jgi:hypothetical protein